MWGKTGFMDNVNKVLIHNMDAYSLFHKRLT